MYIMKVVLFVLYIFTVSTAFSSDLKTPSLAVACQINGLPLTLRSKRSQFATIFQI